MNNSVLIVGYGIVGKNLAKELSVLNPDISDKQNLELFKNRKSDHYDFIFICVDTPFISEANPCDISAIEEVLQEYKQFLNPEGIFIIKSTILPKTTERLIGSYHCNIVFSPEYYGATNHCNNFDFDFTILGGEKNSCVRIQQLLQKCYDGRHIFRITNSRTAELVKYMENSWLATKVSFCGQFFEMAENLEVLYEELRELFLLDPRVNPSHTFIYREKPYWDSHCLNKDVKAIAITQNADFLKGVISFNEKQKQL